MSSMIVKPIETSCEKSDFLPMNPNALKRFKVRRQFYNANSSDNEKKIQTSKTKGSRNYSNVKDKRGDKTF